MRESFQHPFPRRNEPAPIFDGTEPVHLFQARCRSRARDAAAPGLLGQALSVYMLNPLLTGQRLLEALKFPLVTC